MSNPKISTKIELNDYTEGRRRLSDFKDAIQDFFKDRLFEFETLDDLRSETFKLISHGNVQLGDHDLSQEKMAEIVLNNFHFIGRDVTVSKWEGHRFVELPKRMVDLIQLFDNQILGLNTSPKIELDKLMPSVKDHLNYMNDLIKEYEEMEEVQNFLYKRELGRNHSTKVVLDFYVRGLSERQKVLDYYLKGVYERALEKSKHRPAFLKQYSMDLWSDYPYELGKGWFGLEMDFREIDCAFHRFNDLDLDQLERYQELYKEDRKAFYAELFLTKSPKEIFKNISFYTEHLPKPENRKNIFWELKKLFDEQSWLAFYALALPQVEGLFSEMIQSFDPKSSSLHKSLPDKVRSVRPFHNFSQYHFDYFEYVLPDQRNSFSHSGYVSEIEVKAYDILTDLEYVTSVFASLKSPLVNLNILLKTRNYHEMSNYRAIKDFCVLVNELHSEHKKDLELASNIDSFCNDFLIGECFLENIVLEALEDMIRCLGLIHDALKSEFGELSWDKANQDFLNKHLKDKEFLDQARWFFIKHNESIEYLITIQLFFLGVKRVVYKSSIPNNVSAFYKEWEGKKKFIDWLRMFKDLMKQNE